MTLLLLEPQSELHFYLSYSDETARCTMTLRHPGTNDDYIAFKVKTTQPRRYLVRPNQGLVAPGSSETVAILLVDKDKQALVKSYESLGQSALDHAKDKFLVQTCVVNSAFSSKYKNHVGVNKKLADNSELYDALNSMWSSAGGGGGSIVGSIHNKKLHVRLFVGTAASGGVGGGPGATSSFQANDKRYNQTITNANTPASSNALSSKEMLKPHDNSVALDNMSPDQLVSEVTNLKKKYDELVSFSVNLTAERDILNNTLEQTKRELNRELAQRSAIENKSAGGAGDFKGMDHSSGKSESSGVPRKSSLIGKLLQLLVIGLASFLGGVRMKNYGSVDFLDTLPMLGEYLTPPEISNVVTKETTESIEEEPSEEIEDEEIEDEEDEVAEDISESETE